MKLYITMGNIFCKSYHSRIISHLQLRNICNPIPTFSTVMIKKSELLKCDFDSPIAVWIDLWIYAQILRKNKFFYSAKKTVFWRIHDNSLNGSRNFLTSIRRKGVFNEKSDNLVLGRLLKPKESRYRHLLEKINKSGLFDEQWYIKQYPDVKRLTDALVYYLEYGWSKGHNPSEKFNNDAYLHNYADVLENPLVHYVLHGKKEGRICFNNECNIIFPKNYASQKNDLNILMVSHAVDITGAPVALLNAAKILKDSGFNPYIYSPVSGELEAQILESQIPIIYATDLFARGGNLPQNIGVKFDLAICNTARSFIAYDNLSKILPAMWWIHEMLLPENVSNMKAEILSEAKNIYVVSEIINSYLEPYVKHKTKTLLYPIEDRADYCVASKYPIRFAVIGALDKRKNQELFIEAIKLLPEPVRKLARFDIIGNGTKQQLCQLKEKSKEIAEISYFPVYTDKKEYDKHLQTLDAVVAPSLQDPFPIVITEGMMFGKIPVISDMVGHKDMIMHGKNGFVFPSQDAAALSRIMEQIITDKTGCMEIKKAARQTFAGNFAFENIKKQWLDAIEEFLPSHTKDDFYDHTAKINSAIGKKPVLYLHIGTHKTGTTALQNCMAKNKHFLMENGICYSEYAEGHNSHVNLSFSIAQEFYDKNSIPHTLQTYTQMMITQWAYKNESGLFHVKFTLPKLKDIVGLRFHPDEGRLWDIVIDSVLIDGQIYEANAMNASSKTGEYDSFMTYDPIYTISAPSRCKEIEIRGRVRPLSFEVIVRENSSLKNEIFDLNFYE